MSTIAEHQKRNKNRSSYTSILKYTGLFGGVQGFNILISIIRNKCAAVLIGAAGIGLTDILNRTSDFIGSITNLGLSFSGVRQLSEDFATGEEQKIHDTIDTIRAWCVGTGIIGCLICILFSSIISTYVFNDTNLTPAFLVISPMIAMLTVYGGEIAVLKGTRNLKKLAIVSVISSVFTLVVTVSVYLTLGLKGVPYALLAGTTAMTATALAVTHKIYPWALHIFSKRYFKKGKTLLFLGIAYVISSIAGSGAEIAVRAFISSIGSKTDVGLYASGFILCVTYTRIIFIAMDADYFPKLSAICKSKVKRNITVCRQIDVCVLLMGPMLIAFITFLPVIVKLLYSSDFIPAIEMCVAAGGYLFVKAIVSPIEYIPLANNDSKIFLLMELAYDIIFVCLIIVGYDLYGLCGAGMALTVSYIIDLAFILVLYRKIYGFCLSYATLKIILVQGCFLLPVITMFAMGHNWEKCIVGCAIFIFSALYSVKKLNLSWNAVKSYIKRRKTK